MTRVSGALQKGHCTWAPCYAAFFAAWYTGNRAHSFSTWPRTFVSVPSTSPPALITSTTSQIQPATSAISFSPKPHVVDAGEPRRNPEVTNGDFGSLGTEFLFTVMCARPSAASTSLP